MKKVIRLKLTCHECGAVGHMEITKKDLKKMLKKLKTGP